MNSQGVLAAAKIRLQSLIRRFSMYKLLSGLLVLALLTGIALISPSLSRADDTTPATPPTGSITGTVVDSSGTPVSGVKVTARLVKKVTGAPKLTATTADDGTFTINNVPDGKYNVSVRDKTAGKGKADKPVIVVNGGTVAADTIKLTAPADNNAAAGTTNNAGNGAGQTQQPN
jgi:Carboxypeptidase regulatory-like domain